MSQKPCDLELAQSGKAGTSCVCGGSGWVVTESGDGYTVAKECSCRNKLLETKRLNFANIPVAFKDMRLNNFSYSVYKQNESKQKIILACKLIKKYLENFKEYQEKGMGLYIHSDTKGSGKTRMVASIANELIRQQIQVKFATSTAILQEIKRTWEKGSTYTESGLLDALSNTSVLIIDDFGTETYKDWIGEKFYQIVNDRYVNKKITILTSNYSLENIGYDTRIINRLKEITFQISFPEESIREYIAKENRQEILKKVMEVEHA